MNLFGVAMHLGNAVVGIATGDGTKVLGGVLKATSSAIDGGIIGNAIASHTTDLVSGEAPLTGGHIIAGLSAIDNLGNQDGVTDLSDLGDIIGGVFEGIGDLFS
jgi:hypothetical protein